MSAPKRIRGLAEEIDELLKMGEANAEAHFDARDVALLKKTATFVEAWDNFKAYDPILPAREWEQVQPVKKAREAMDRVHADSEEGL